MLEADQATPRARRTAIAQKAKLIKTRGLRKADLEVGFVFMRIDFYLSVLPLFPDRVEPGNQPEVES